MNKAPGSWGERECLEACCKVPDEFSGEDDDISEDDDIPEYNLVDSSSEEELGEIEDREEVGEEDIFVGEEDGSFEGWWRKSDTNDSTSSNGRD